MYDKIAYKYSDLEIRISDTADEDILYLLDSTIQGSEGGMRYSLQNVRPRIMEYRDRIRFVSLYRKNQLTGTIGACFRISGQGRLRYPSSYLRYLSIQPSFQLSPDWRSRRRARTVSEKDHSFKQKVLEIFSKPHLFGVEGIGEGEKHIMYAFLESMNERSKNLVIKAGYEYIRSFLTVAFSRFNPKCDPGVVPLEEGEKDKMKELISAYYRDYSLFTIDYAFSGKNYYVLKENNEIIAGVSAIPGLHKIYHIPGVWGWIMMKVLPTMPYYKRLFSPDEFRYLVFDAVYCREGREADLARLFESACAAEGYFTGLMWLDDRSSLFDKLRSGVKMGALNRMLNAKPGLVFVRFINFSEKEKEPFYDSPAYVSGFDFS